MIRSFLAIPLPDDVSDRLMDLQTGVRNARWIEEHLLHITLVFLGHCSENDLRDLDAGLAGLRSERFSVTPKSVGAFGGSKPRLLYAGLADDEPLRRLRSKIEHVAREAGLPLERRKFSPHITLARCGGGVIPAQALDWTVRHGLFAMESFEIQHYGLYRSDLGTGAPVYTEMARYELV